VLENHHCAAAFDLLNHSEYDVLECLSASERREVRRLMIASILATDMAVHFTLNTELQEMVQSARTRAGVASPVVAPPVPSASLYSRRSVRISGASLGASQSAVASSPHAPLLLDILIDKDRFTVIKSLLHAADISNPVKPFELSKKWSDMVVQEFFEQGEREKAEGLPLSPNMDRQTTFQDELSLNFLDFIVGPFYFSLSPLIPKLHGVYRVMHENRNLWDRMLRERERALKPGEEKLREVFSKWDKRTAMFDSAVTNVLSACKSAGV